MNYQSNNFENGPMELEEPYQDSCQYFPTQGGCFVDRYTPFSQGGFYNGFESPRARRPAYAYAFEVFPHHHQTPCIEALINDHKESRLRSPEYEPWYPVCNLESPTFQSVTPLVFENKNLFESPPKLQSGMENLFINEPQNRNPSSPIFQSQEVNRFDNQPFENNNNNNEDFFEQQQQQPSSPTKPEDSLDSLFVKEDQNPNQDNEGVETGSPQGSDWGGEELWANASFGDAAGFVNSFSLNNDDDGEIPVEGLILNGLDEFSGIFDPPTVGTTIAAATTEIREEEQKIFVMTPKLPEMSEIDISLAHSDDFDGECLQKKLKLEKN